MSIKKIYFAIIALPLLRSDKDKFPVDKPVSFYRILNIHKAHEKIPEFFFWLQAVFQDQWPWSWRCYCVFQADHFPKTTWHWPALDLEDFGALWWSRIFWLSSRAYEFSSA